MRMRFATTILLTSYNALIIMLFSWSVKFYATINLDKAYSCGPGFVENIDWVCVFIEYPVDRVTEV